MNTLTQLFEDAAEAKSEIYRIQNAEITFPGDPTNKVLKFAEIGAEITELYFLTFGLNFNVFTWLNAPKWLIFLKKVTLKIVSKN